MAVAAFVLAAARINHGLIDSSLPAGPGLTLDESFNIGQGVYLAQAMAQHGPLLFSPATAREVFGAVEYLPDHPPLGRVILGVAHQSTAWLIAGAENCPLNVPAARLGSCCAFACLILVMFEFVRRTYDQFTATASALCLMLMPQFVGHARLATLETATVLMWFCSLLPLLAWWTGDKPPTNRQAVMSGVIWGLLMLTKMQGILLPPLVFLWAVYQYHHRAILPLMIWGLVGAVTFFVSWPWLWLNPAEHVMQYLGRASERQTLYVWYMGERYADKLVPWHFPLVMTLITVPVFVLLGAFLRVLLRQLDNIEKLLLASFIWPLIVFALPGTPVYDGTRLFLCIMPSLAVLAARGFCVGIVRLRASRQDAAHPPVGRWVPALLLILIIALAKTTADRAWLSPYAINEYNDLTGRGRGAAKLGMEACYWSDALNGDFWKHVPENSTIYVAPVSHQFQLYAIQSMVPVVAEKNIRLIPFEYDTQQQRGLLLLLHRLADLRQSMRTVPDGAEPVIEVSYDGVVLARLMDTTLATWTDLPE